MPTQKPKKTTSRKTTKAGRGKKGAIDDPSSYPGSPPLFPVRGKTDAIDERPHTSRKTARGKKDAIDEPSSPARSSPRRKKDTFVAQSPPDNHGVLVNPHDVDDPALTAVDPSVSEINYDVPSPCRSSPRRVEPAKDAITDNSNECGIGEEVDDADESEDSGDEDYRGDIYDDEYSDGDDDLLLQYRVPSACGKGAGRKPNAGRPPKPDTKGMSEEDAEAAVTEWEKKWKKVNDANRRTAAAAAALQDFDESIDQSGEVYSDICTRTLREMRDVEINPLRKDHTFPNKEILMLRIAEEANLFGVRIQSRWSDCFQLQVAGLWSCWGSVPCPWQLPQHQEDVGCNGM